MKFNSNDSECLSTKPHNLHVSFDRGAVMKAAGGRTGGMPGMLLGREMVFTFIFVIARVFVF